MELEVVGLTLRLVMIELVMSRIPGVRLKELRLRFEVLTRSVIGRKTV